MMKNGLTLEPRSRKLLQVGELVLLTPKTLQVPQLADQIVASMEGEGVSLTGLLEGIQEERRAWQEHQQDA